MLNNIMHSKLSSILNKYRWDSKYDFDKVVVWYLNRGSPNNSAYIEGKHILAIGELFLETSIDSIPLHRILKIIYDGKEIFTKQ